MDHFVGDYKLAQRNTTYHCFCSNSFGTYGSTRRPDDRYFPPYCPKGLEYCGDRVEDDHTSLLVVYIAGRYSMHTRTIVNRQTADHTLTQ